MFKSIDEAFNAYKDKSISEIEKRAKEVKGIIETDPECDFSALRIELTALDQAKQNIKEKEESHMEDRNLKVITGIENTATFDRENVLESKEYRSAFFKTMQGKTMNQSEQEAYKTGAELRASTFTGSADAAAVIPTETLNEIIVKARKMGGLIAEARSFSMPSKIAIPVATPGSAAAWHTEGAGVDAEKVNPASVMFDANEIMRVISVSAKTSTMAIPAFESYLTDELSASVMETLSNALVNGTGAGQGKGIETITFSAANKNLVTLAGAEPTYRELVKVPGLLKAGYHAGAKFAMNTATLYNSLYGLTDTTGRPVFISDPKGESIGKVLGFDVVIDDHIADGVIYFGNFKYLGYNMPESITVEKSTQSSFRNNLIDYRVTAIADCRPIVDEAFVKVAPTTNA